MVKTGRTLDYLVWCQLVALEQKFSGKPAMEEVRQARVGGGLSAGTCSPVHFKRMQLEKIGALDLRPGAIHELVPELAKAHSGDAAGIHDISASNNLSIDNIFNRPFQGPLVSEFLAG